MSNQICQSNLSKVMNMDNLEKITLGIVVVMLLVVGFNAYQISQLKSPAAQAISTPTGKAVAAITQTAGPDVIPKGIPDIYGKELGVSFDDVSAVNPQVADNTIRKLGLLDEKLSVDGKDKERYIAIASRISCEYCCGAESIILPDGKAACGCAHSYAMRGLAKYLIQNHAKEYTDDQILEELGKWKTLFFPSKITAKAKVLQSKSIELNYINLASNKYRNIEKGTSSTGMVGGC